MLAETPYLTDRDVTRAPVARRQIPGAGPLVESGDERERLVDLLRMVSGNKQAAARSLGISRRAFYRRLERYGLHTTIHVSAGPVPA